MGDFWLKYAELWNNIGKWDNFENWENFVNWEIFVEWEIFDFLFLYSIKPFLERNLFRKIFLLQDFLFNKLLSR